LRRARSLKPTDFGASFSLAGVLRRAGRLDEAIEILQHLTRTHSDEQRPYLQLIEIYEEQGNSTRAVQAARRLASRYPEEPVFQELLEQLEQARGARP
jgi:predicted Zn-dependent protease